jgi:hypothetical protein
MDFYDHHKGPVNDVSSSDREDHPDTASTWEGIKAKFVGDQKNYLSNSQLSLRRKYTQARNKKFEMDTRMGREKGEDLGKLAEDLIKSGWNPEIMKRPKVFGQLNYTVKELREAQDEILAQWESKTGMSWDSSVDIENKMKAEALDAIENADEILANVSQEETPFPFKHIPFISNYQDLASTLGGLASGFGDPVTYLTAPIGAVGTMGILKTALAEAGANMVVEASLQPTIKEWQDKIGRPYGLGEMAESIALAGVIGGAIGGGVKAIKSGAQLFAEVSENTRYLNKPVHVDAELEKDLRHIQESDPSRVGDVDPAKHQADIEHLEEVLQEETPINHNKISTTDDDILSMDPNHPEVEPGMKSAIKKITEDPANIPTPSPKAIEKVDARNDIFPQDEPVPEADIEAKIADADDAPEVIAREDADFEAIYGEKGTSPEKTIFGDKEGEDVSPAQLREEFKKDQEFIRLIDTCSVNVGGQ